MATVQTPELRVGSYLRYKADTDRCLSWLFDAAVSSGYSLPLGNSCLSPQSPKVSQHPPETTQTLGQKLRAKQALKAAKRKERDDTGIGSSAVLPSVKRVVKTQELVDQAKMAAKKGAKVPLIIVRAFERAIAARKRSAAWYQSAGTHSEQSNIQHQHFITLLENVFRIVRPCVPHNPGAGSSIPLLNRFEALDVEDIEDDMEDLTSPGSSTCKAPEQKSAPTYEFEFEDSFNADERLFAITCFFEDLRSLRAFVTETWQTHKDGSLDLRTACFVTNAAIEIARKEEESLISRFFPPGTKASQKKLAQSLQSSTETATMTDEESTLQSLMLTPFDDFVYNRPRSWMVKFSYSLRYATDTDEFNWPFAVPLNDTSHVPPDQRHLLEQPAFKKMETDEIFFTQLLLDLIHVDACYNSLLENPTKIRPHSEFGEIQTEIYKPLTLSCADAFSRGFRKWIRSLCMNGLTQDTSTWFAFAGQIQLDIRDILGSIQIKEANRHLESRFLSIKENLNVTEIDDGGILYERDWPKSPSSPDPYPTRVVEMVVGSMPHPVEMSKQGMMTDVNIENARSTLRPSLDDLEPVTKESKTQEILQYGTIEDYNKRRIERAVLPSEDPYFLPSSTPLACGTRLLELDLAMEHAGLAYANYNGYAFVIAHLYNAVRQLNLLKSTWQEMEHYIQLNIGTLFFGTLPRDLEEFTRHYAYKMGVLPSSVCSKDRKGPKFRHNWGKGPQLPPNQIIRLLQDLYDDDVDMNMQRCLAQLQTVFQKNNTSQRSGSKPVHRQSQLSSLQLLRLLRTSLPPTMEDLHIDYLGLTRMSKDLLKRIRFTIVCELGVDYSKIMTGKERYGHGPLESGYFLMVMGILSESDIPQLEVVAKVLEKHITGLRSAS